MSVFSTQLGHAAPYVSINIECYEQSYNVAGNYSIMYWRAYVNIWSGSRSGTWDWNAYVNGSQVGAGSVSASSWSGERTLGSGTITVYHDENGYANPSCSAWLDDYYATGTASGYPGTTRLALEPQGLTQSLSTVAETSFVAILDISSRGHGTLAAHKCQYKLSTAGSYSDSASQDITDLAPNTFTISSLAPNSNYNYRQVAWNNNGDTATAGAGSLLTLGTGTISATSNLLATSVTLNASITASQTSATNPTVKFQYRKQGDSTWIDSTTSTSLTPAIGLSGLMPSTTYEYRLSVINTTGTWTSSVTTFTTLPAGKIIMPNGDVLNAIPRLVYPNGSATMVNINTIE